MLDGGTGAETCPLYRRAGGRTGRSISRDVAHERSDSPSAPNRRLKAAAGAWHREAGPVRPGRYDRVAQAWAARF